jgi:hypothetical protein
MKRLFVGSLFVLAIFSVDSTAGAVQVALPATQDNSMYSEAPNNSNGLGDHFIAGRAGGATSLRRGLVAFDIAGIPAGSRIDRVALELWFQGGTNMENDPRVVSLHPVLTNWGEGTSDSGPGGTSGSGNGAAATASDVTWQYNFFNTQTWSSYDPAVPRSGGGDFLTQPSAATTVGINPDVLVSWETIRSGAASGLVADVEHWLANPTSNFGWLLKMEDEAPIRTARRFYSKDAENAAFHPRLVIDYTVVPEPTTLAILLIGGFGAWSAVLRRRR